MKKIFLASLILLISGCYQSSDYSLSTPYEVSNRQMDQVNNRNPESYLGENQKFISLQENLKPWELFEYGRDLYGNRLNNRLSLRGDELASQGMRAPALSEYIKAKTSGMVSPQEKEALVLRIASLQLSQDRAQETLSVLSRYFVETGSGIDKVKPPFAVVFGYAYGRVNNIDQAIAWFSHANKNNYNNQKISDSIRTGVGLILKTVSDNKLASMADQWRNDDFISSAIVSESNRRNSTLTPQEASSEFSENFQNQNGSEQQNHINAKVVALLPLSGAYAGLGESVKNGISLVFENRADGTTVEYLDTYGDGVQAASYVHGMVSRNERPVIIGPLLAAPAMHASNVARPANIPMITLSKRSDFVASGSVFRLGTTTESQVSSVLEKTYGTFGMTKYALIYPATESGLEYANAFEKTAREMRLDVVYKASYQKVDPSSFITIGKVLENIDVEGVFLPSDIDTAVTFMQALSETTRSKIKLLGTPAWDDVSKLERSKHLMNNVIFVTPFYTNSSNPLVQSFINTYRSRFAMEPDFMAAQGFDVATLVAAGLQSEESGNGDVIQSLHSISQYNGVTGSISSSGTGELLRKLTVIQYQNGQLMEVMQGSSGTSPLYVVR